MNDIIIGIRGNDIDMIGIDMIDMDYLSGASDF